MAEPKRKDKYAESKRRYRETHRDEIAEKRRRHREAHRDEIAEKPVSSEVAKI